MERQLEVEFRDLVVDDEDDLIGDRGLGSLQAQQGVEVNQIPVRPVIGVQQAVEVAAEVLPHGRVFLLKLLELVKNRGIEVVVGVRVRGHACKFGHGLPLASVRFSRLSQGLSLNLQRNRVFACT